MEGRLQLRWWREAEDKNRLSEIEWLNEVVILVVKSCNVCKPLCPTAILRVKIFVQIE